MTVLRRSVVLLTLLAAACGSSPEPASAPSAEAVPVLTEAPPVYSLLGYRDRLELTSAQVVALDSIGRALQDQNGPLLDDLREMARRTGRSRSGRVVFTEEMRPLVEGVRENNERAMSAVKELLTDGQEATACRINEDRERDRPASARGGARRGAMSADSTRAGAGRRGWSWCGAAAATETTKSN